MVTEPRVANAPMQLQSGSPLWQVQARDEDTTGDETAPPTTVRRSSARGAETTRPRGSANVNRDSWRAVTLRRARMAPTATSTNATLSNRGMSHFVVVRSGGALAFSRYGDAPTPAG